MTAEDKEIVLITGANTGLGLAVARMLLQKHGDRFYCLIGCRTFSKGESAVKELHGQGLTGCEVIEITVTDDGSILRAATTVEQKFGRLDVLYVNAGVSLDKDMIPAGEPLSKLLKQTFDTNVVGAAQTVETFVHLLEQAENPRVNFMTTALGSLERASTFLPTVKVPAYSSSKAALNMIMIYFWRKFPNWKVNACCPGFRATALTNFGVGSAPGFKPGTLEDGAVNAVRLSLLGKDGESGTNTERDDKTGEIHTVPW